MKRIYKLLFLLFCNCVIAQSKEHSDITAEYDIFFNTEYPVVRSAKLIIDKNYLESFFLINPKAKKINDKKDDDNFFYIANQEDYLFNHFDYKKNELITKDQILSDVFLIKENIPKMDWVLYEEEKVLDNKIVKKATTFFRGRKFIAWYSLDFPIRFGPWKFNGLPGLIFEIYDETNRYHWLLKSITKTNLIDIPKINMDNIDVISIKEFVDLRYNQNVDSKIISKLPRNVSVISSSTKRPARNGIEIFFEWEENND